MRTQLQLAAASLLFVAGAAGAQIHLHGDKPAAEDLSWMWQYTQPAPGSRENALALNARFKPFLEKNFTAPQTFWGKNKPLSDVAIEFLSVPGEVIGEDNRYITADGCVPHFCSDRGLLWVDQRRADPLAIFAAIEWISENKTPDNSNATYTMWVFANRALDPKHIPAPLTRSIARWTGRPAPGSTDLQNITRVYLIYPDGTPQPLSPATIGAHNALPAETSSQPNPSSNTTPKAQL
jgi:hypothetical protein